MASKLAENVDKRLVYLYLHSIRSHVNNVMYYYRKLHDQKVKIPIKEIKDLIYDDITPIVRITSEMNLRCMTTGRVLRKLGNDASKFFMMFSNSQPPATAVYEAAAAFIVQLFALEHRHVRKAKIYQEEWELLKKIYAVSQVIEEKLKGLSIETDKTEREDRLNKIREDILS